MVTTYLIHIYKCPPTFAYNLKYKVSLRLIYLCVQKTPAAFIFILSSLPRRWDDSDSPRNSRFTPTITRTLFWPSTYTVGSARYSSCCGLFCMLHGVRKLEISGNQSWYSFQRGTGYRASTVCRVSSLRFASFALRPITNLPTVCKFAGAFILYIFENQPKTYSLYVQRPFFHFIVIFFPLIFFHLLIYFE